MIFGAWIPRQTSCARHSGLCAWAALRASRKGSAWERGARWAGSCERGFASMEASIGAFWTTCLTFWCARGCWYAWTRSTITSFISLMLPASCGERATVRLPRRVPYTRGERMARGMRRYHRGSTPSFSDSTRRRPGVLPSSKHASIQLRLLNQANGRGGSGAFDGRRATGGKRQN